MEVLPGAIGGDESKVSASKFANILQNKCITYLPSLPMPSPPCSYANAIEATLASTLMIRQRHPCTCCQELLVATEASEELLPGGVGGDKSEVSTYEFVNIL